MKKTRAIILLVATVVLLAGYVAWAAWDPAPTLQALSFHTNVDADARRVAEADFRSHPPQAQKLTWQRFWNRLAYPWQRQEPLITVAMIPQSSGTPPLVIFYPREHIWFARRPDGKWHRSFRRTPPRGKVTWIGDPPSLLTPHGSLGTSPPTSP